jgi:hypothetical protein
MIIAKFRSAVKLKKIQDLSKMFINPWPLYHGKEIRYNKRSTSFAGRGAVSMTIYQLECLK